MSTHDNAPQKIETMPNTRARICDALVVCCALLAGHTPALAKTKAAVPQQDDKAKPTGCEYLGEGYVKAPGSDTCFRVSGSVRSETSLTGR